MKTPFIVCLFIGLTSAVHTVYAFQLPKVLERGIIDDVIDIRKRFFYRLKKAGTINTFYSNDSKIEMEGISLATPLWMSHYSLCKLEVQTGNIGYKGSSLSKTGEQSGILKIGMSGRHILDPELVIGLYGFYDSINFRLNHRQSIKYLINSGIELIAPRYANLTLDAVFNPYNLFFDKSIGNFYKASARLSLVKPRILDIGLGVARIKYPRFAHKWHVIADFKGRMPVKKWNLNQHGLGGLGLVYDKQPELTWSSTKNLKLSLYVQFDLLPQKSKNSLRDYLKMPIDRSLAIPYHPAFHAPGEYPIIQSPSYPIDEESTDGRDDASQIEMIDRENVDSPPLIQSPPYARDEYFTEVRTHLR